MFPRIKKSGRYEYLQIVETRREGSRVVQRVIGTIGRMDRLQAKGEIEALVRSLARYSEKVLLVLSGRSDVAVESRKIGPALLFGRLWEELGIKKGSVVLRRRESLASRSSGRFSLPSFIGSLSRARTGRVTSGTVTTP